MSLSQKEMVETIKIQWRKLWQERVDDKLRAEGIATADFCDLFVEKGTIIHATRNYKPLNFKEILMQPSEAPWELYHRLKCKIRESNMNLTNEQHRECFVASLLPHLRVALSQQKITTQAKALDIAMRLHETPM